jgi:AcrR family transcriptional regulator
VSAYINKKAEILNAALQLFSDFGSKVVSTKKIAIKAEVSEGLIFQHFKNKEGLINALYERELDAIQSIALKINSLSHPKVILSETLSLPFLFKKNHFLFCKWYSRIIIDKAGYKNLLPKNVINKVEDAFKAHGVNNLTAEIDSFWVVFEGFFQVLILNDDLNDISIYNTLKEKFNFL